MEVSKIKQFELIWFKVQLKCLLLCFFRYRIEINDKIPDIILFALVFAISPPLLLATTTRDSFARNYCVF